jgi:hypothetical protein
VAKKRLDLETGSEPGLFTNIHRRGAENAKITRRTGLKLEV